MASPASGEQRRSFAYGSLLVENDALTRASVVDIDIYKRSSLAADVESVPKGSPSEINIKEVQGLLRQFDGILASIIHIVSNNPVEKVSLDLISNVHHLAMEGIDPYAGQFRQSQMTISGSEHNPPPPADILLELRDFCKYVNENWENFEPIHLAAYSLWQINRIHPFVDGNGRTARALSYLILSAKKGHILPGSPTIPEQIAQNRQAYFDALQDADMKFQSRQQIDVSALEYLLNKMLLRQISQEPALSDDVKENINDLLLRRFFSADERIRTHIAASGSPKTLIWAIDDHIAIQIADQAEIHAAELRREDCGILFPGLLATDNNDALEIIEYGRRNAFFTGHHFYVQEKNVFYLKRDASLTCRSLTFDLSKRTDGPGQSWILKGTLYVVRYGFFATDSNIFKSFESILARDTARIAL